MSEGIDQTKDPIEEARMYILSIMDDCYRVMGNNDNEHDLLQSYIDELLLGEITPEEAKEKALIVYNSKTQYR